MMLFSTGTRLERIGVAGLDWNFRWAGRWLWMLDSSAKTRKKEGSAGASPVAAPMPKSVSSLREKIDCLEGECVAYLSSMGWPGIYSICFS